MASRYLVHGVMAVCIQIYANNVCMQKIGAKPIDCQTDGASYKTCWFQLAWFKVEASEALLYKDMQIQMLCFSIHDNVM